LQVWARSKAGAARVAGLCGCPFSDDPAELMEADLYILAVSDRAVKALKMNFGDGVAAHTAGSVPLDALAAKNRAVFYPLQTFTKGREVDFRNIPILIEGNNKHSLSVVREVARALSGNVMEADSHRRLMLHTAAVFTNNFANHMYTAGEALAREAGFDFEILKPLIAETAAKALDAASPADVQTGPAVRNDFETRSRHTELLAQRPYLQNLYINISKNIWETSKKISR
jgi:predicted short-subunit dehydrogenase-like oxidoreductase (DUF2520 family)